MLNTFSGVVIGLVLTTIFNSLPNPVVYLGDGLTTAEIFIWTGVMTIVSILRSYCWRRFFASKLHRLMKRRNKLKKVNYTVHMKGNVGKMGFAKIPSVLWEAKEDL